ncbi:MAG: AtpZ/AtpI family protein [Candidatus Hydrogenedentes bacterium]|nr:AtpZ/AtpI family protein [Candidatus Hydrogenedentota bacterium]
MKSPKRPETTAGAFQLLGQLGLTMVACCLGGLWAGHKLDRWLAAGGLLTALGVIGGVAAGALATGLLLYRNIPPWKP